MKQYTVSEITQEIRNVLEGTYPSIIIEGEVSNFHPASSGHWYFSLKDEKALIQAVMFRNAQGRFRPSNGQMVRVWASLSVYPQRGAYQLVCTSIREIGEGQILQMLEERKAVLAKEGLFDAQHKIPLPFFPRSVLVLTSTQGAAVRDIINVLSRRATWLRICVANIPVQGEGAAEEIIRMLKSCEELCDVIILSRGGGSIEDLLPFSDENLVRAIYACKTAIISAIGHEIDWTLSDLVADLRAPTPSAAAEMLCANVQEIGLRIMTARSIIFHSIKSTRERLRLAIRPFGTKFLEESIRRNIYPHRLNLDSARESLLLVMKQSLDALRQSLHIARRELDACSPFSVMDRGYAIVRDTNKTIISRAEGVAEKSILEIEFKDGLIDTRVISSQKSKIN